MIENYGNSFKEEHFECQTNGIISDSIVQNWTLQALECYKLNSNCAVCPITKARYSFKCQMKHIVDILLKTKGLPDEKEILKGANVTQVVDNIVA
ncbi:MAG: hypothetical protein E7Z88_01415 [Cyanobacteria bacterium SIG27]|nr:hypothetical protein [Cyanobacteria bacterium SIG27]